ncbi:MAG: prephenate/arogenate dehydrogenase family protein [Alphaproteobacteria bacterium]|nr:prephenate/arogenate dehydrogenase family protein [Alphaproteobacteria bacterium]
MSGTALYDRVALVGIGLIGSSIARALRRDKLARHVACWSRRPETRETTRRLDFCDSVHDALADAVRDADLVILCAPLGANAELAAAMAPHLKKGATISDVGSVKQAVIRDVGPHVPEGVHFVPGHPVAGTEHSGPDSGFAELFERRWCILTPPPGTDQDAVARLTRLWQAMGSKVEIMDAKHHDRVLAITSHLPHLIAYTIVGTVTDLEDHLKREAADAGTIIDRAEIVKFSAGGFRDFTRIAASDPIMWRDIFLNNRESVLEMLGRLSEDLAALQRAIRWGEGDKLEAWFRRTRVIRRGIIDAGQAGTFAATEPEKP